MNKYVRLPSGNIEIEHIREMVSEIKEDKFKFSKWKPRLALIDKKSNTKHLFTGQTFDKEKFQIEETGWTDDHCMICFKTLGSEPSQYIDTEGYFDGYEWVYNSCYTDLVIVKDLEKKLEQFGFHEE